ncbi:MAG: beta-galactosidase trimerization domain-containing protein [Candidatus Omnitrophota bacterium]
MNRMNEKYKSIFRALMIDQHFPDAPYITFEKFSAREQLKKCLDAGIDSLHLTTKCHWGYSYYDTKFGVKHPALGKRDMVKELVDECRKNDVEAVAYYCIGFDNLAARTHPDWRFKNSEGKDLVWYWNLKDNSGWRWDMACINTGFRKYCLDQIAEFTGKYKFDSIMLDIFHIYTWYKSVCFCQGCQSKYRSRGLNPYSEKPEERFLVMKYWCEEWAEFLREIRAVAYPSDIPITVNGGPTGLLFEGQEVLKQLDWVYSEGGERAWNCVVLRGCRDNYAHAQCGIWGGNDIMDAWPQTTVRLQAARVLAHGNRTFFFFTQGRSGDGTFADSKYQFLKGVNRETARKQKFVRDSEPVKAVGVCHDENTWLLESATDIMEENKYGYGIGKIIDVFRGLSIPCEFIPDWRMNEANFKKFKLLVISEMACLEKKKVAAITDYVREGGNLLVTAETGLRDETASLRQDFLLADLLGIRYRGICRDYEVNTIGGYLRFRDHPLFKNFRKTDYLLGKNFVQVECTNAEPIAWVAKPVGVESRDAYIGWGPLPPGNEASWPAVTIADYGKGKVIYTVAPLGRILHQNVRWPAVFLKAVIDYLKIDIGLRKEGPSVVEAVFVQKKNKVLVHLLNNSIELLRGEVIPITGVKIIFDQDTWKFHCAGVVYPKKQDLKLKLRNRLAVIEAPPVQIHTIIEISSRKP